MTGKRLMYQDAVAQTSKASSPVIVLLILSTITGLGLTVCSSCGYNIAMSIRGGRPQKTNKHSENLKIRVESAEKQAFKDAADLAGIPLSVWVRERLRRVAVRELEAGARPIAFLPPLEIGGS